MSQEDPTSVFRRASSGAYTTTIPRTIVDAADIDAGDTVGIHPTCNQSSLALSLQINPDEEGAHIVSIKMQGPRNRQAVFRPPRRLAAVLRLEDVTVSWQHTNGRLRATVERNPLLSPGYLGGFANATSTTVVQRGKGTYYATLPTEKVRALGLTQGEPVTVAFDCLQNFGVFILRRALEEGEELAQFALQMGGPQQDQPRVTVTRALGDGLQLAGETIDWVQSQRDNTLLGRYSFPTSI